MQRSRRSVSLGVSSGSVPMTETVFLPVLRHPFCKDKYCQICLHDAHLLAKYLEDGTDSQHDHGGSYHGWLSSQGIEPETDDGWWHPDAYRPQNLDAYIADWKEKHHES